MQSIAGHITDDTVPMGAAIRPRHPGTLAPGHRVGSYIIIEQLGEGGMGRVFCAEHAILGRRVALKQLRPELVGDPAAVLRFVAEARAVQRIQHPNIVTIHDFVAEPDGGRYQIMDLLVGQTLRDAARLHMTLPRVLSIAKQVCQALTAAHEAGIVHRDLKPDNLFLVNGPDGKEQVKVLDFGVAVPTGASSASSYISGTPAYMSPEQVSGAGLGPRSDIYALGVILFELVSGKKPFSGKNIGELWLKHLTQVPPPLASRYGDPLPKELPALVAQCLAKRPEERPESMRQVLAQLEGVERSLARLRLRRLAGAVGAWMRRAASVAQPLGGMS